MHQNRTNPTNLEAGETLPFSRTDFMVLARARDESHEPAEAACPEPMTMQIPVRVGDQLAGRYRVDGALAEGGTSVVLFGTDLQADRPVAIKILLPRNAKTDASRSRFEREIQVLRGLRSECVVKVLDEGSLKTGEPFMVMEHLSGRTLKAKLRATGPLPVQQAVDYVLQACEVLAEAHGAGVVHRDVKPENLFLVERGAESCVKVLDFGLSKAQSRKAATRAQEPITRGNEVMGSPYYMAPEQMFSSRQVDRAADIWSIGVVLYELLTGQLPFAGNTIERVRAQVMTAKPASILEQRPDVPPDLEAVVMRCLQKVPDGRYKGLAVLAASLAPFGTERARRSAVRVLEAAPLKAPPPLPLPARSSAPAPTPSSALAPSSAERAHPPSERDLGRKVAWGEARGDAPGRSAPRALSPLSRSRGPSPSWTLRARRARQSFLVGVGLIFFVLGLAVGVVASVWQHSSQRSARLDSSPTSFEESSARTKSVASAPKPRGRRRGATRSA